MIINIKAKIVKILGTSPFPRYTQIGFKIGSNRQLLKLFQYLYFLNFLNRKHKINQI